MSSPSFVSGLILVLGMGFATRAVAADDPPPPLSPEKAEHAAGNYQRYCALCHGKAREGHANDHAPSLRSRSLIESGIPMVVGEAIAYGRPGTPMGGYLDEVGGPLTRADIRELTLWLRDASGAKVEVPDYERGSERIAGDVAKGAAIHARECVACHGTDGKGGTGTALANPAMLALTPDIFLRHAIVNGRQDTPMPPFGDKLSAADIDDVTAFLRSRSTDWSARRTLSKPPALGDYVINKDGDAPLFGELAEGRYVSAKVLDRELRANRRMVLLDTRVTSMWQMAHIEGAVPAPYYANREEVVASLPRDGTWIVAYCECPRAAADSVVKWLREEGKFSNTAVLYEGIQGWVSLGYPVVAGDASKPAPTP